MTNQKQPGPTNRQKEHLWKTFKDEPDPVEAMAKDMVCVYKEQGDPLGYYPDGLPLTVALKFATKVWADVCEQLAPKAAKAAKEAQDEVE